MIRHRHHPQLEGRIHMHIPTRILVATAAVALLVPLTVVARSPGSGPSGSPDALEAPPFEGTRWHLREFRAEDGGMMGAWDGGWITFADHQVTGSTGCNDLAGSYLFDGATVSIGISTPTEASCLDGDLVAQEMALLGRLPEATRPVFDGGDLWLFDAQGGQHLRFVALQGRTWVPVYDAAEPMPQGYLTLRFTPTRVHGQGPCNTFGGTLLVDGASIAIRPLESTRVACPDLELEDELLNELQVARSYAIEAGDLVLLDEQDAPVRRFTEASTAA